MNHCLHYPFLCDSHHCSIIINNKYIKHQAHKNIKNKEIYKELLILTKKRYNPNERRATDKNKLFFFKKEKRTANGLKHIKRFSTCLLAGQTQDKPQWDAASRPAAGGRPRSWAAQAAGKVSREQTPSYSTDRQTANAPLLSEISLLQSDPKAVLAEI